MHLAGRAAELRRFRSTLRATPEIPGNIRLTGLRGVGKTVLLSEFERLATEAGWLVATMELEPRHNRESTLLTALGRLCEREREGLSRVARIRREMGKAVSSVGLSVSYEDVTLTFDPSSEAGEQDLSRALFETSDAAVRRDRRGFALLLDEAQVLRDERSRLGEHPLSLLIAAVSVLQKVEVPLVLVLCGLPTLTANLLAARTYSERMFRGEEIGSLDPEAAREAFVEPLRDSGVRAEPRLVDGVLEAVEGYPYFIQLWGAELWDAAYEAESRELTLPLLAEVEPEIFRRLDFDFYDPRVATLTPAEQDLLLASAACPYPPLRVSDLNEATDKSPGNVNVLLGRLVSQGILYRLRKGQYEYTAHKFYEYLQRRTARP